MRGLAEASDTVPRIRPPRKARKHYGTRAWDKYDPLRHDLSRRCAPAPGSSFPRGLYANTRLKSVPDPFKDEKIIEVMDWFIRTVRASLHTFFSHLKPLH